MLGWHTKEDIYVCNIERRNEIVIYLYGCNFIPNKVCIQMFLYNFG